MEFYIEFEAGVCLAFENENKRKDNGMKENR